MPATRSSGRQAELRRELERRFRTMEVTIPVNDRTFRLLRPVSAEELISEEDFTRDERLPYWAELWPSSIALAPRIARMDGRGRRLIELGCGIGLVSCAAASAGFDVLATDYYEDALRFTRENTRANSGREVGTQLVDWRAFPESLRDFDVVLAADVLYERPYGQLVPEVLRVALAPNGVAIVADPGRVAAPSFVERCVALGLMIDVAERVPFEEGRARQTIDIYHISLATAGRGA